LALATAEELAADAPDGIRFVDLSALRDPALVLAVIRQALELPVVAGETALQAVTTHLRDRRCLLLLDNFEHVLAAAPLIAELLQQCSRLRCLVTSRAPLRIRGEQELCIPPLTVPEPDRAYSLAELGRVPAVALFTQRARAVRAEFGLTDATAPAVAEICRRLDGLPLALELAAHWTRILPAPDLL